MSGARRAASGNPAGTPRDLIQIGRKRKIAFVCSGGATKAGAFHLGVALALQEQGFKFYGGLIPRDAPARPPGPMEISTYIGSSAGSIIATYLAAGYSLDNIFNSFLGRKPPEPLDPADATPKILPRLTYQKMFKLRPAIAKEQFRQLLYVRRILSSIVEGNVEALLQLKWLKATGFFSTAGIEQYLREEVLLSNRFQDYLSDLFIVGTQLNHSRKVVFGKHSHQPPPHDLTCQYDNDVGISEACAASTSLPVIYAPYPIQQDGRVVYYIDGEIRDTLSTHVAVDAGADLVIASYTHQPYHFLREVGSLTDYGLPAIVIQSIYLVVEQKINNYIFGKTTQRNAINAVEKYCIDAGLPEAHRRRICEIMERELHHRRDVDSIYIRPNPTDAQLFFGEHFSLSPKRMSDIVKSGFRAAIETLRKYEFADRKEEPAIGHASNG
jgi:predicted acylesterase/phospholipase RssA